MPEKSLSDVLGLALAPDYLDIATEVLEIDFPLAG